MKFVHNVMVNIVRLWCIWWPELC